MNLSTIVEDELNQSPFIREALDAGILNISSLSRYINDSINRKIGYEVTPGAIGMTIKRLPVSQNIHLDKSITKFMRHLGDITVRSDLADFSFRNSPNLLQCQGHLLNYVDQHNNYFYSSCKGVYETTIICSAQLEKEVSQIFEKEELITSRIDLAAVSILLPPTNLDTYGVYYTILKKLAWKGINIVEVLSTSHEISLIISEDDVEEVFSIILKLKNT